VKQVIAALDVVFAGFFCDDVVKGAENLAGFSVMER
jgi:hypothetical protein